VGKSYSERNQESIARTGMSLYQVRQAKGQGRGHHPSEPQTNKNVLKGTPRTSTPKLMVPVKPVKPAKPVSYKPPKIMKRVQPLPRNGKIVTTYSPAQLERYTTKIASTGHGQQRIYFELFNKRTNTFVPVYFGHNSSAHGITAAHFFDKATDKVLSGQASTLAEGIVQTLTEDMGKDDSPTDEEMEMDEDEITQVRMYIMPQRAV
jgi:hypothetical protein